MVSKKNQTSKIVKVGTVVVPFNTKFLKREMCLRPYANKIWSEAGENCTEYTIPGKLINFEPSYLSDNYNTCYKGDRTQQCKQT